MGLRRKAANGPGDLIMGVPSVERKLRNGASLKTKHCQRFDKKLLVLDLNGTLLDRAKIPYEKSEV